MKEIVIDGVEYTLTPKHIETEEVLYNDWRLPSIQELLTLVDYTKVKPACKLENTTSDYYWSSTTNASNTDYAWYVNFSGGYTGNHLKSGSNSVRCVRDSEHGLQWSKTNPINMNWKQALEFAKDLIAPVYKEIL